MFDMHAERRFATEQWRVTVVMVTVNLLRFKKKCSMNRNLPSVRIKDRVYSFLAILRRRRNGQCLYFVTGVRYNVVRMHVF